MSERSARHIEDSTYLPSQPPERNWRTRSAPLEAVWDSEVVPLLQTDARLNAVTLLEELQRRYPGQWDSSVLRTLQRRVRLWRAKFGSKREVYFAQEQPPGRQCLSDFTVVDDLCIEIDGVVFAHRLYQSALAYSGWRHAAVIDPEESFMELSTGLQAALELALITRYGCLGKVTMPFLLRSENGLVFTSRSYTALAKSYGLQQEFITPCTQEQNGMVERAIRTLKEQCVHRHPFETRQYASRVIGDWIGFYNCQRPTKPWICEHLVRFTL